MPSDRIRQHQTTGEQAAGRPTPRPGATGSDLGGAQGFGGPAYGGPAFGAEEEEAPRRSRFVPLVIAFFALAAFAGIVWYAYEWGVGEVEPEHLPVVQAPSGPIKEKPAEPGGLEVPYTDSAVLNRSAEGQQAPRVESLLPPPEEPLEVPEAPEAKSPAPSGEQGTSLADLPELPRAGEATGEAAEPAPRAEQAEQPDQIARIIEEAESIKVEEAAEPATEGAGNGSSPEAAGSDAAGTEAADETPATEPAAESTAESTTESTAEQPVGAPEPVAEAPAGDTATSVGEQRVETDRSESAPAETPEAPNAEASDAEAPEAGSPEAAAPESPVPETASPEAASSETAASQTAATEPTQTPSNAVVEQGDWVVQLAALRREDEARSEWSRIQRSHAGLLGTMSLALERADLGDKGIYYRVQTGPFSGRSAALDLCAQLKAAGQDCIAKRR